MSDLKVHLTCMEYVRALKRARRERPCVSAGELARRMGVSRSTALKYLTLLVRQGRVVEYEFTHVNGMTATAYIPAGGE